MKEEWLFPGAMVPVDVETTAALVTEIKRLIDVVGGMALAQPEQEPVEYCTAYYCAGDCGQPHNQKEMQEFLRAQPEQEPVARMNNKDFEPIRVRIMQEAYELADRNDSEGYNAIKVMCGDVQRMLPPKRTWVSLTDEELLDIYNQTDWNVNENWNYERAIEAKLRSKNR